MGRRALRRVDPQLDLSRHFKALDELPQPWDPVALFRRAAPLEVEIGSGKGLFLVNAGRARPDVDFLGTEISRKYARFAAARLARNGVDNGVVVHGDALRVVGEVLPEESAAAVHVYFPDPWWKARHKKRRVMNETFLGDVVRCLQPGGALHFWTDVPEYYQTSLELITARTPLDGPLEVRERPAEHDLDYRTNFERRVRLKHETVYRAEFRKDK